MSDFSATLIAGREAICVSLRFRMLTLLRLQYNRRLNDLKSRDMIIVFMQYLWYVLALAVIRLRSFLATVLERFNIGCIVLRKRALQDCTISSDRDVRLVWIKSSAIAWVWTCVSLRATLDIARAFGMDGFLAIIFLRNMVSTLVSVNVKGCFINLVSGVGNPALLLRRLIQFFSRNIKKLIRLAKRDNFDLWFEDECHFQQHGSRCVMWIPSDVKDPITLHAPTRKHIGILGAVRIADGTLVAERAETFDADTFQGFLKRLLRRHRKGSKMVIVVDNARWHHAKLLTPWLRKYRHALQLLFLPPYSPELNTIERVWKLTRRLCTHNQYFPVIEQLIETILHQLHAWSKPNDTLRRLCAII